MKKKFLFIAGTAALMVGLASCSPKDAYKDINGALSKEYFSYIMTVVTDINDCTLTSSYTYTKTDSGYRVEYSIQEYNTLDLTSLPSSQITTKNGTENVEGKLTFEKFKVTTSAYSNIVYEGDGVFSGDVTDGKTLLGVSYDVSDCKVSAAYAEGLTKLVVSYTAGSAENVITYDNFVL